MKNTKNFKFVQEISFKPNFENLFIKSFKINF